MNKHQKDTWLSIYLFYNEPWEDFLQKAVEPYVNTAIQTGIAQQYFFIRYWERGPHIRLRLKGEVEMVYKILKPNMEEHFNHYFESKPSQRTEPNYPDDFSDDLKWLPNNALVEVEYQPEIKRFGGEVGMLISEKQFMLSSKTVLDFLNQKGKTWSYDDAMGIAIKLHLSFVHAVGLGLEEATDFFDFFVKNWLPHTYKKEQGGFHEKDLEHHANLSLAAFDKSFDTQKETLIPFHTTLWEALERGDEFEQSVLNDWVLGNKSIASELIAAAKQDHLQPRSPKCKYQFFSELQSQNKLLWSIFADYIHLTNNRLGITNKDEPYLCFMMMKCLQEIKKKKAEHLIIENEQLKIENEQLKMNN